MREAIADARKKGGKMGCFRAKWFEAQAAELAAIKVEQEQERKRAKEQIEELQAQVHDTADAVQAAGELLVRLREAYESVLVAEVRNAMKCFAVSVAPNA
jgi:kinesin family protein 15